MKKVVVVFNQHGAKISSLPWYLHFFNRKNIVVMQHIEHLRAIPMMFWKKSGQIITEMTRPEKVERLNLINKKGPS